MWLQAGAVEEVWVTQMSIKQKAFYELSHQNDKKSAKYIRMQEFIKAVAFTLVFRTSH